MPRRLLGKRFKMMLGGCIVALTLVAALLAPYAATHDPDEQALLERLQPPFWHETGSAAHWLGTDNYGRDLFSRLIYGSRISILVGFASMLLSCFSGSLLGMIAGYRGGKVEQLIMRLADAHLAIPDILLAILIVAAIGGSAFNLVLVLGISGWMVYARLTFGMTRALRERGFVEAAVSQGASDLYIISRHIFPQLLPVLVAVSTLQVAHVILQETALSFLGLGVPPPAATWGNMLAEGRDQLWVAPWIANLSGLTIVVVVWATNLLGNALREHLDPKPQAR
jgi:peptide/nickel transport system permease protein